MTRPRHARHLPPAVSGQATTEYVALVALVGVALALAAGLSSGGIGGQVLAGLQRGLCRVAGAPCPRPEAPRADLPPCPVERRTSRESLEGAFELVRLGHGATLSATRGSDGRVTVELADGSAAGVETGAGLRVAVARRAQGPMARAGVGATVASGQSWTFPDPATARAFIARYGGQATLRGKAAELARRGCSLLCDAVGWRSRPQLPPPDELHVGHGATAELGASLGVARWRRSAEGLLGARVRRDGTTTWYLQLETAASAGLDLPLGELAGARASGVVVSYVRDASRRPVELGIHVAMQDGLVASVAGTAATRRASAGGGAARLIEVDATIDLHDTANRTAADQLVTALRHPLALPDLPRRVAAVRERIAATGRIDRRTYAVESSALEVGATVGVAGQLGGAFARTREGMRLLHAETRLPGLPFLPRDDCRAARGASLADVMTEAAT